MISMACRPVRQRITLPLQVAAASAHSSGRTSLSPLGPVVELDPPVIGRAVVFRIDPRVPSIGGDCDGGCPRGEVRPRRVRAKSGKLGGFGSLVGRIGVVRQAGPVPATRSPAVLPRTVAVVADEPAHINPTAWGDYVCLGRAHFETVSRSFSEVFSREWFVTAPVVVGGAGQARRR